MTTPKPIKAKNAPTRPNFIPCQIKGLLIKPFVAPTICMVLMLGLVGAFLALIGLGVVIYYLDKFAPSLGFLKDYISLSYLSGGVLAAAFIITWLSTFFATQRFLNLQTEELYY